MSLIVLHGRARSFNVRAVMWGIAELGLGIERREVGGRFGGHDAPEYLGMTTNDLRHVTVDCSELGARLTV